MSPSNNKLMQGLQPTDFKNLLYYKKADALAKNEKSKLNRSKDNIMHKKTNSMSSKTVSKGKKKGTGLVYMD